MKIEYYVDPTTYMIEIQLQESSLWLDAKRFAQKLDGDYQVAKFA